MAEYMLRDRLDEDVRWDAASAGVLGVSGMPPSREAVAVLRDAGIDASTHRSRPLTRELVDAATLVVVMTRTHREQVLAMFPGIGDKIYLLTTFDPAARDGDVDDPIGLPAAVYSDTYGRILAALPGLIQYLRTFDRNGKAK